MQDALPFWKIKTLSELSEQEWESLCDGCGQCCMHKLEDEDTGKIHRTSVACILLDKGTCSCADYKGRFRKVPDCTKLTEKVVAKAHWLPKTCAYRLVYERKDLPWWHHLVSHSKETVHSAGVSVLGKIQVYENELNSSEDFLKYIIL